MHSELREFADNFGLTPREREVFFLLANKVTTFKDIAQQLKVSPSTINNHFKSIFNKTDTNSKAELLASFLLYIIDKFNHCRHLLQRPHVLVVDDEPEICELIGENLTRRGVKVYTCTQPKAVMDLLSG